MATLPVDAIPAEIAATKHEIKKYRAGAAEAKARGDAAEAKLAPIAAAAGVPGSTSAEEILAAGEELMARAKSAALERIFTEVALEQGADPTFTWFYLNAYNDIDTDVDPEDHRTPGYLAAQIRTAMAQETRCIDLKAAMRPKQRRAGTAIDAAPLLTPDAIDAMTPDQINRAYKEGRLNPILGRR